MSEIESEWIQTIPEDEQGESENKRKIERSRHTTENCILCNVFVSTAHTSMYIVLTQ
jgi:hypothetical protein